MASLSRSFLFVAAAAAMLAASPAKADLPCTNPASITLSGATVDSMQWVPAGSYTPPGWPNTFNNLPAFCRVTGTAHPTPTSVIKFEVWLPEPASYNGKFEQVGNGGFAGAINYDGLADGIRRHYAAASTDDGHQNPPGADFVIGPGSDVRIADYGWRAVHETSVQAKAIIQAYKGAAPSRSYFFGCSDGGREALMEAQRFHADFNGIIAGAPANFITHQVAGFAWDTQAAYDHATFARILPPKTVHILSEGVRAQCVGKDGGVAGDKFLTDPRICKVDLKPSPFCFPNGNSPSCLNNSQTAAISAIYEGPHLSQQQLSQCLLFSKLTKRPGTCTAQVFPGFEPGSEDDPLNWQLWITGPSDINDPFWTYWGFQTFFGEEFFAKFVKQQSTLINLFTDISFPNYVGQADQFAHDLNSTNPDLHLFQNDGGKLIQYAGWGDSAVAPMNSIDYYESVKAKMGYSDAQLGAFYRLFMVPGMGHCQGGLGANEFGNDANATNQVTPSTLQADAAHDVLMALDQWVTGGPAPGTIVASQYKPNPQSHLPDTTAAWQGQRPLCAYPKVSRYDGHSDPHLASSFICAAAPVPKLPPGKLKF